MQATKKFGISRGSGGVSRGSSGGGSVTQRRVERAAVKLPEQPKAIPAVPVPPEVVQNDRDELRRILDGQVLFRGQSGCMVEAGEGADCRRMWVPYSTGVRDAVGVLLLTRSQGVVSEKISHLDAEGQAVILWTTLPKAELDN